jgi:hypothetical protein
MFHYNWSDLKGSIILERSFVLTDSDCCMHHSGYDLPEGWHIQLRLECRSGLLVESGHSDWRMR